MEGISHLLRYQKAPTEPFDGLRELFIRDISPLLYQTFLRSEGDRWDKNGEILPLAHINIGSGAEPVLPEIIFVKETCGSASDAFSGLQSNV